MEAESLAASRPPTNGLSLFSTREGRNRLLLALAGFNLILLNYTLVRQMTVAFYDLETSVLLMVLAYFAGISLGYLRPDRIATRWMSWLLPVFLILQMVLVSTAPLLVLELRTLANIKVAYAVIFLLVMVGSTSLYALFLPRIIQSEKGGTKRYYSAEILGSLVALCCLPIIARLGMVFFYGVYFAAFLGVAALVKLRPWILGVMLALMLGFLGCFDWIDKSVSAAHYQKSSRRAVIERIIFTRYSPYHKIEVAENKRGERYLFLNSQRQFGPGTHANYSYFVAEYPARLLGTPSVCLLGCGSMSTVGRIGDFAQSIQIVDLDSAVFETSRVYFADFNRLSSFHNWAFHPDDAKHFLGTTRSKYDLIIDDIPPAKTRQVALTYTREFFQLVRARLNPRGIFSLPSLSSLRTDTVYGRRMLATLVNVFDQVVVLNDTSGSYYFATDRETTFDSNSLRDAVEHQRQRIVGFMLPVDVREYIKEVKIITINNMADLIFSD